ncbi:adenosylcobinamide-GDP ribazoletransferase [Streptomyces sp. NRRL S-15]|uniref:adenosylcobinamide-GDP ribazoletransferase n=1 Tax=Streptomyces sp. NRRL S-15 TaxID=1463886 RepID=UPI0004C66400|nr:adenosylcobinamide-GDP ribazoletransferase [Streptomyces sp. NRRL S-15]
MTSLNGHGLRFAFGTLTALPVGVSRWDRGTARAGMLCAPLAGLAVGLLAAVPGVLFLLGGSGPLVAAVASAALPAALTRGLHLDGLADTADGLGSAKPAGDALRIMKQSDIGPFGVITLLFVLLAQVAALFELYGRGWADGALGTVVAAVTARLALAVTARLALTLAARRGVPSARPEGLGAAVAGTVPRRGAAAAVCAVLACCAAAGALLGGYGAGLHQVLAVAAGLAAAQVMLRHCVRRFGGVTGDVFGALEETAGTVALLALSLSLG